MEAIKLNKNDQFLLFEALKNFIPSNDETARNCGVSPSLVGFVRRGVNQNEKVMSYIFKNLKEGWEDTIPTKYYSIIKEY